jgi:hypothetical protein
MSKKFFVGVFTNEHDVLDATTACRDAGFAFHDVFVPYAICIWTSISNIDCFKDILYQIYKTITFSSTLDEDTIRNFQYAEVLNIFNFLNLIIKPPPKSSLVLNFRKYTKITF